MTNSEQEMREDLQSVLWDLVKDVTGVRPRWMDFDSMSVEEMEKSVQSYQIQLEEVMRQDAIREQEAIADYEALIQKNIEMGATNRQVAVQWLVEAYNDGWRDVDVIFYELDLPFFKPEVQYIKEEMKSAFKNL